MKTFNIYIQGVGGQGIGLLSEVLIRAIDYSNQKVKAVDTHGLAQRGGVVVSQIRLGKVTTPIISKNDADLVITLERDEAMRAMLSSSKEKSTLIYYDTSWQGLEVRLNKAKPFSNDDVKAEADKRSLSLISVFDKDLPDVRMQNVALLGVIAKNRLIPEVEVEHYEKAMADLLPPKLVEVNKVVFDRNSK